MRIYLDTEFTDLIGIVCDIKLISAGFVGEDGSEFYAELTGHYEAGEYSTFVHEAVLPNLNAEKYGMCVKEFLLRLKVWIQDFKDPVVLYSDAVGYDYGLLLDLWIKYDMFPTNLVRKPVSANSHEVQQGIENYFQYQPLAIRHQALWDARALAFAVKAVENGVRF
jgi:hypothetical protein